jgi:hypothetical protein
MKYAEANEAATDYADTRGALSCHAYDQPEIAAGAGTLAEEITDDEPGINSIVVAVAAEVSTPASRPRSKAGLASRSNPKPSRPCTPHSTPATRSTRPCPASPQTPSAPAASGTSPSASPPAPPQPRSWSTRTPSSPPDTNCGATTASQPSTAPRPLRRPHLQRPPANSEGTRCRRHLRCEHRRPPLSNPRPDNCAVRPATPQRPPSRSPICRSVSGTDWKPGPLGSSDLCPVGVSRWQALFSLYVRCRRR